MGGHFLFMEMKILFEVSNFDLIMELFRVLNLRGFYMIMILMYLNFQIKVGDLPETECSRK